MTTRLFPFRLLLLCASIFKATAVKQLFVGNNDCGNYYVNEDQEYEIVWNTGKVLSACTFGFQLYKGVNYLVDYKTCVDVISYNVQDCGVVLNYYLSSSTLEEVPIAKSFSCGETPPKTCGYEGGYFSVVLLMKNGTSLPISNNFRMSVKAVKFSSNKLHFEIVGGVLGGILFIATVISVIVYKCIRRHRTRDARLLNGAYSDEQTNNTDVSTSSPSRRQTYSIQRYVTQCTYATEQQPVYGQQPSMPPPPPYSEYDPMQYGVSNYI